VNKPPRRAALIVNTKSRKGQAAFRDACRLLGAAGIELVIRKAVKDPAHLPDEVRKAVVAGVPMVIVGGGDGSISSSIDHVVGKDIVFALLPLGTANSFARTLGIPLNVEGAVRAITTGRVKRIDLGMIGTDYFANCAAIGLSPLIAKSVPHGLKKWLGRPGYLAWAALQMARFKPFRLAIRHRGEVETLDALEVRIANGRFHRGYASLGVSFMRPADVFEDRIVGLTEYIEPRQDLRFALYGNIGIPDIDDLTSVRRDLEQLLDVHNHLVRRQSQADSPRGKGGHSSPFKYGRMRLIPAGVLGS